MLLEQHPVVFAAPMDVVLQVRGKLKNLGSEHALIGDRRGVLQSKRQTAFIRRIVDVTDPAGYYVPPYV